MSQFNWTYLSPNGGKHNVGIFHGSNTGHVLVYCNSRVVLVDFKVRESKSYSIFIEDELCEINIEKRRNTYAYSFDINREADTPFNLQRKKNDKKHFKQGVGFLAGIVLLVSVALFGFSHFDKVGSGAPSLASMLASNGTETSAQIVISNPDEATYHFVANGKTYSNKTLLNQKGMIMENGMPLEEGDEFIVRYSFKQPQYNQIKRPTKAQIEKYKVRALNKYLTLHSNQTKDYAKSIVDIAWEKEGINGLAKIYLQDLSPKENVKYNSKSFQEMINHRSFQRKLEKRSQKTIL